MVRGIYTGASGMISQQAKMDVIANNLANVDKTAFKKDTTIFKAFPDMIIRRINDDGVGIVPTGSYDSMPYVGKLGTGVEVNEVFTQFEQGSLQRTESQFDLALEGEGFFTVMTERGERYIRNGSFTINDEGILMTHNGNPVMGENGIIRVQKHNFVVKENGEIVVNRDLTDEPVVGQNENEWQDQVVVDKLKIVDFEYKRHLKKAGTSMYMETEESGPALPPLDLKIRQGFLEKSNVNIVRGMVEMIEVQRSYEANQKSVLTADQTLGKLINEVGR
ncbi:MAG: flagellar hook-basal body protein [Spirochaetes bacterium]|jgi:flagellar basal-body rod protein FlgF|nr:flagellar hook-basal body protein [Spirochaetota bacterium]